MDELLFNINDTLSKSAFPISTVQNEDNIYSHHISKTMHDPTVEERESSSDQNSLVSVFPFVFQETSDDDFCQTGYYLPIPLVS
jgi:hypothetical protein